MAIQLNSVGQMEHERISFVDAVVDADVFNGAFGEVDEKGIFKVGANKTMVIMQVECGDDAAMPKYPISKGSHVRVLDLEKCKRNLLNVYDYPLPDSVKVGDKLVSKADGSLEVSEAAEGVYLEVESIIGNYDGVVVKVVEQAI